MSDVSKWTSMDKHWITLIDMNRNKGKERKEKKKEEKEINK